MPVPFTSEGYGGTITEEDLAVSQKHYGARFGVEDEGDWQVRGTSVGGNRSITISPGTGFGDFIRDTTTAIETFSLDAATSTDRWDLVVCRRNWAPEGTPGGTSSFVVIKGSTSSATFNPRPVGFTNNPGVTTSDQPLALCRVRLNQALVQEVVDLRSWTSKVHHYKDVRALPGDAEPYTVARVGGVEYTFQPNEQGTLTWANNLKQHWGWYWGGRAGYGPWYIPNGNANVAPGSARVINVVEGRLYRIHTAGFRLGVRGQHNKNYRILFYINENEYNEHPGVVSDLVTSASGVNWPPIDVSAMWRSTVTGPVTISTRFAAEALNALHVQNPFDSPFTEVTEMGEYNINSI